MDRRTDADEEASQREAERRSGRDRRLQLRTRTLLGARLLYGPDQTLSLECRLRDVSPAGARAITSAGPWPQAGVLIVPKTSEAHQVRVLWARGGQAGLAFDRSWRLEAGDLPPELRPARRLWEAIAPR